MAEKDFEEWWEKDTEGKLDCESAFSVSMRAFNAGKASGIPWEVVRDNCRHHPKENNFIVLSECIKLKGNKCTQETCPLKEE